MLHGQKQAVAKGVTAEEVFPARRSAAGQLCMPRFSADERCIRKDLAVLCVCNLRYPMTAARLPAVSSFRCRWAPSAGGGEGRGKEGKEHKMGEHADIPIANST